MSNLTKKQAQFVAAARAQFPNATVLTRPQIIQVCERAGLNLPQWLTNSPDYRAGRGQYRIPALTGGAPAPKAKPAPAPSPAPAAPEVAPAPAVRAVSSLPTRDQVTLDASLALALVPERLPTYVPFGCHKDLLAVVKSRKFYPVFISGLSGNGKTTTVEQVCAETGREFYRVNITAETTEDDLLGGFRLVDGATVWFDGPVVLAMKRGGVLLLDEVDLGTTKIMCLQPVLEGKPVFLKKINQWATPAPGFNAILTGNTKGRGDETGKFVGTNVLNEAFLERIPETVEQGYPTEAVETKILSKVLEHLGTPDDDFAKNLVRWAATTRKSYEEGASDDLITTRRLVQAANAFSIYGDRLKAIEKVVTRFDPATRDSFVDLYKKLDAEVTGGVPADVGVGAAPVEATATPAATSTSTKCPF
jgi:MoxR-like ATPase